MIDIFSSLVSQQPLLLFRQSSLVKIISFRLALRVHVRAGSNNKGGDASRKFAACNGRMSVTFTHLLSVHVFLQHRLDTLLREGERSHVGEVPIRDSTSASSGANSPSSPSAPAAKAAVPPLRDTTRDVVDVDAGEEVLLGAGDERPQGAIVRKRLIVRVRA